MHEQKEQLPSREQVTPARLGAQSRDAAPARLCVENWAVAELEHGDEVWKAGNVYVRQARVSIYVGLFICELRITGILGSS